MPAPKQNQFWKKRAKSGRDKIFSDKEELRKAACEYFKSVDNNPFYKAEQRKGAIVIPRGFDGDLGDLGDPIIEMAVMRPYTMTGLCIFLGVNKHYFNDFKKNCDEGFSEVISWIEDVIYTQKFEGAAAGLLNANIISRDLGLVDKVQQEMIPAEKPGWLTDDIGNGPERVNQ